MTCPHCRSDNSPFQPFSRPVEGGLAFAQTCQVCGHVLGLRPRLDVDPPAIPGELSSAEAARLEFVRWRMGSSSFDRSLDDPDYPNNSPRTAA